MTLTAGTLSQVSVGSTTDSLSATAATSGTTPYSYQWYRSTSSGFSPGTGNAVSGATSLTLNDSSLIPGTQYYYKMVVIDSAGTPASASYSQLAVMTSPATLSQNQFQQATLLGELDQAYNYNTKSVMIDPSVGTASYGPGTAMKIYNSSNGVITVVPCTANADNVFGFIAFNIKDISYGAGKMCELAQAGNVIWLYATGSIPRGDQVTLDLTTVGGVGDKVGSSGNNIVGYTLDQGTTGQLIRVELKTPSFTVA